MADENPRVSVAVQARGQTWMDDGDAVLSPASKGGVCVIHIIDDEDEDNEDEECEEMIAEPAAMVDSREVRTVRIMSSRRTVQMDMKVSVPSPDEECPITTESIARDRLDFLSDEHNIAEKDHCFFRDAPQLKKATLPCGHAFGVLNILFWFVAKKVQCPICRKGVDDELISISCVPAHLVYAMLSKVNESRATGDEYEEAEGAEYGMDGDTENEDEEEEESRGDGRTREDELASALVGFINRRLSGPWTLTSMRLHFIPMRGSDARTARAELSMVYPLTFTRPMDPAEGVVMWLWMSHGHHLQEFVRAEMIRYNEGRAYRQSLEGTVMVSRAELRELREANREADLRRLMFARIVVSGAVGDSGEVILCDSGVIDLTNLSAISRANIFSQVGAGYGIHVIRDERYPYGIESVRVGLQESFLCALDSLCRDGTRL